jgi:hypothetical protein
MSSPRLSVAPTVCIPSGRWGRRRVRVSECEGIIRAEAVYDALLMDSHALPAFDARFTLDYTIDGRRLEVSAVRRPNAVWRFGRVFLICPSCRDRRTRLYLPRVTTESAGVVVGCRVCLGLTYRSRSLRVYRDVLRKRGIGAMLGTTYRDEALHEAMLSRSGRYQESLVRRAARRPYLTARLAAQEGAENGA